MAHFDPQYPPSVSDPNINLASIQISDLVASPKQDVYINQFASASNVDLSANPLAPVRITFSLELNPQYNKQFPDWKDYVYLGFFDTNVATTIYLYHQSLNEINKKLFKQPIYPSNNEIDADYDCLTSNYTDKLIRSLNLITWAFGGTGISLVDGNYQPIGSEIFMVVLGLSPILNSLAENKIIQLGGDPEYMIHDHGVGESRYMINVLNPSKGYFVQKSPPYGCEGLIVRSGETGTEEMIDQSKTDTIKSKPTRDWTWPIIGTLAAVTIIGGIVILNKSNKS